MPTSGSTPRAMKWLRQGTERHDVGYQRPNQLSDALSLLATGGWTVLAGGTDLYPATESQVLPGNVLDISGLTGLRGISDAGDHWRFGARTTWSDIRKADLPPAFRALQSAAAEVGGVQIQNAGTLAGNLCNASPAADGVPALMILDAGVELSSAQATRVLPLSDFLTGPRRTALAESELLTAVHIPKTAIGGASSFVKLGARKYLVISIAMVAVRLATDGANITQAAISVGACSGVAARLTALEDALIGVPYAEAAAHVAADLVAEALSPIDDVRGTADYRTEAAAHLIRRAIAQIGTAA